MDGFRVDDWGYAVFHGKRHFDKVYHAQLRHDGWRKRYSRKAFKRATDAIAYCRRWVTRANRMADFIRQSAPIPQS
jgi:predicted HAD superfamily Cof-like phosphohydrolase